MLILNKAIVKFTINLLLVALTLWCGSARSDYVGELETTKYFDQQTINLISSRLSSGSGLLAGDQISYIIQFTPTDNGGMVGGGGYVTDYIPAGVLVVGAQFVRVNSDGTTTAIAPPSPAEVTPPYLALYSDTGIFYSTDPRTAPYPASATFSQTNGYTLNSPGCTGISLPSTTHNSWDQAMVAQFANASGLTGGTCTAPPTVNYNTAGLSPVAGPDTYLTKDSTGATGPWQRISYAGSMLGTATGPAGYTAGGCVGGTPTTAGWNLSASNPLPVNTNAVRFAAGKVTVGELFSARIVLQLRTNMPLTGILNNVDVFGGDASLDPGNAAGHPSTWNQWRYFCPSVATSNSQVFMLKTLIGACVGSGCTPTTVTSGVVPSAANLRLRYQIIYMNASTTTQTNVVLKDTFATGAAYVAGSYVQTAGTSVGTPTASGTNPVVLTYPTIANLPSGAMGSVQYDVNYSTAPANGTALINKATLTSTQIPAGVSSSAIATTTTTANLWISKTTSTGSVTPGATASYSITVPNTGAGNATGVIVHDYLPSAGGSTTATRFAYVAGSAVATITSATGTVTPVTLTVSSGSVATAAPYTGLNRELLTFTLPTATAIPSRGYLTITFNTTVGASVPASTSAYTNDANAFYVGGAGGTGANSSMSETIGTAPVFVTIPLTLAVKVSCVYASATSPTCVPYTNGTIAPGSKVKYRIDYSNVSLATLSNVVISDILPPNTTYVANTALFNGTASTPSITGQTLAFSAFSLLGEVSGYATFDVQLGTAVVDGTNLTDTASIVSTAYPSGVVASVTTSVRNQATLVVTKTTSTPTVQPAGTVSYTITVSNTGSSPASGIMVYDELPYTGTTASALTRFNYQLAGAFTFTDSTPASGTTMIRVTPTTSVPPTFSGYTAVTNQQEILWNFGAQTLAAGASFSITYTASTGANIPAGSTAYYSDVQVEYVSATNTMYASTINTAGIVIGGLDHIQITHTGNGLTCEPAAVTLTACSNSACTALYTAGVTVTLSPGGQTFAIGASGVNSAASVSQTTAGIAILAVTGTSSLPLTAATCWNTGTASSSCAMNFTDSGLILWDAANSQEMAITPQVAGVAFAQTAGSPTSYILRAVKQDKKTSACVSAFSGGATQTIGIGYECNDPTFCTSGNLFSVNGTLIQGNANGGSIYGTYGYTSLSLNFDANGFSTTPLSFSYEDVGQVTLHFYDKVNGKDVFGTSNAFVVAPHHLEVDLCNASTSGDCPAGTVASTSSSPVLAIAGTNAGTQTGTAFKSTIRSMSANNNVTPSFGTAGSAHGGTLNTSETVVLSAACTAPIIAPATNCAGTLSGTQSLPRSSFMNGVSTLADQAWSDVGLIAMSANTNFMVVSSASGTSANAGRFIPDHFNTIANGQMGCAAPTINGVTCPGTMAYSWQPFNLVTVTAYNAGSGATQNYQAAYAKAVSLSAVDAVGGALIPASIGVLNSTTIPASAFLSGSATTPSGFSLPLFAFTTTPTNPTDVYVRAAEPSGADGVSSLISAKPTASVEGSVMVASGRIKVSNAYGSDMLPLSLVVSTQYWNGSTYMLSTMDSVTPINTNLSPTGIVTSTTLTGSSPSFNVSITGAGAGFFASGVKSLTLAKPGAPGTTDISINAPTYLPSIAGRATFGIYKASNNFIYLREAY